MNDKIKFKGYVVITDKRGQHTFNNIVTNGFYQLIADVLTGGSSESLTHMGLGTGTTTAAPSNTSLVTPVGVRKEITFTETTGAVIHLQTIVSGGELLFTWRELGVFTAVTGGIMTNRVNLNYTHNPGETVTIDYFIQREG